MPDQFTLDPSAVTLDAGRPTTTSLIVAEVFGKQHKNVLQAIRGLDCSPEFHGLNFQPMEIEVPIGLGKTRKDPAFRMTRDGFVFLCMGFTGKEAARWKEAYINAFNRMEAELQQKRTEQYDQDEGALWTGHTVELDFGERDYRGEGKVLAEWDSAGYLWLGDQEIDRLLGYKIRNSTLSLYHRYEWEFPEGSVVLYDDARGYERAIFTPMAWAVIAKRSTRPSAGQLALAAVQHYVPPRMIEVERERYQRLARNAKANAEQFKRIAKAADELSSAVSDASEPAYIAALSADEPKQMPRRTTKTH